MSFTPGPWETDKIAVRSSGPDGRQICLCEITVRGRPYDETYDEAIDNARRIVTAVNAFDDMKAALIDALRSTRKDFKAGPDGDRQHREAYAEQFAALTNECAARRARRSPLILTSPATASLMGRCGSAHVILATIHLCHARRNLPTANALTRRQR